MDSLAAAAVSSRWMDTRLDPGQRAAQLVGQMTLDEKIAEVHGVGYPLIADPTAGYAGKIPGNSRLGIPAVYLADSPVGVGNGATGVTQWADTAALAATWDTDVAGQYGRAYGAEQAGKGHNVALGPTINILRLPNWGRAPETFSEDPYLTAQQSAAEIKGIQSQHVIATAKHFVANNQEVQRSSINVVASEKARKEIYQPAFKAAVQAGVGAIMCSYNRVGGTYACANADDLIGTLRDAWNFDGMVMSDWGAVHSTVLSAKSGLDLEMPGVADEANPAPLDDLWGSYFNSRLKSAVQSGAVTTAELDGMVTHILTAMFRIGLFDHPTPDPVTVKDTNVSTPEHQALSERIAEQGTVLLKNANGALPLNAGSVRSIAVIGDAAKNPLTAAGGSAAVIPSAPVVTPLDGITARAGSGTTITYAQGTLGTNPLPAVPAGAFRRPHRDLLRQRRPHRLADRLGAGREPGHHRQPRRGRIGDDLVRPVHRHDHRAGRWDVPVLAAGRRVRHGVHRRPAGRVLHPDVRAHPERSGQPDRRRAQHPRRGHPVPARTGDGGEVRHHRRAAPGLAAPAGPARRAGRRGRARRPTSPWSSRPHRPARDGTADHSHCPADQDALISAVAAANPRTIVVLNTSSAVTMPWLAQVAGVVEVWFPGQTAGTAISRVLFGDVNPSGKLPVTFPASDQQGPARSAVDYPGDGTDVYYSEGTLVGYRWFDAQGQEPLFPFGYGLSYTTFRFSDLKVRPSTETPSAHDNSGHPRSSGWTVTARVTNTGIPGGGRGGPALRRRPGRCARARATTQGLHEGHPQTRSDQDGAVGAPSQRARGMEQLRHRMDRHEGPLPALRRRLLAEPPAPGRDLRLTEQPRHGAAGSCWRAPCRSCPSMGYRGFSSSMVRPTPPTA